AGWRSPIEMRGIRYGDANVEFVVDSARCDRTLLDLLLNPSDFGRVQLESTRVIIRNKFGPVVTRDGSPAPFVQVVLRDSNRSENARWPASESAGAGGTVSIEGPDGRIVPVAHRIDFEFLVPTSAHTATFCVLARTGDPASTSHVNARGTLEWPCHSVPASL